jgi:O-antigen/teichoic acid export membrane protein
MLFSFIEKIGIDIKSQFITNIIKVITGTGLSYVVLLFSTPILTRMYSPSDFGVLGIYQATVVILGVIATGRYELAIPVPKNDAAAWALLRLSFFISISISSIFGLLLTFFKPVLFQAMFYPHILIPLGLLAYSQWMSTELWLNRKGDFTWVAISRVIGAVLLVLTQIVFYFLNYKSIGLIFGLLMSFSFSAIFNGIRSFKIRPEKKYSVKKVAILYKEFPQFLLLSQLLNIGMTHLPTITMGKYFGQKLTGLYSMGTRVMSGVELFATATSQVFFPKAAKDYIDNGNCRNIYNKTFLILGFVSLCIFPLLYTIIPDLFALIFGEEWRESGRLMRYLIPMYFLRFIVSPLTTVYSIARKQKLFFYKTIITSIFVIVSLVLGIILENIKVLIILYSLSMFLGYMIDALLTFKISKGKSINNS